jgi:hypothetical protein
MPQRLYPGHLRNTDLAEAITGYFSRGNLRVQSYGNGDSINVQIATSPYAVSGGTTALSVLLQNVEDGVAVEISKQAWLGIAASLGVTTIAALRNPLTLLNRLDDIAQDIEYVQLVDTVWNVIDATARSLGSGFELSERLARYVCDYCNTPNPLGNQVVLLVEHLWEISNLEHARIAVMSRTRTNQNALIVATLCEENIL